MQKPAGEPAGQRFGGALTFHRVILLPFGRIEFEDAVIVRSRRAFVLM